MTTHSVLPKKGLPKAFGMAEARRVPFVHGDRASELRLFRLSLCHEVGPLLARLVVEDGTVGSDHGLRMKFHVHIGEGGHMR